MDAIRLLKADDMHVHLRQGDMLAHYAKTVEEQVGRALIMPNTTPPITDAQSLVLYRDLIKRAAPTLTPLMTFKLISTITTDDVEALKGAGAVAGKLYPEGVTTNSEDGVRDIEELYPVLTKMQSEDLVLCIHGETPDAPVFDRETAFLPVLMQLVGSFPQLRIVFEHVSTREAVRAVAELPERVAATVTVHHLLFTVDDMMANGLNPHLYCKPLVKKTKDRDAIQRVVLDGNPKFFFGSDSAPHPQETKESRLCAAGVYSAPVAMPLLLEFFESNGCIEQTEKFTSEYGSAFYGIPKAWEHTPWVRQPWKVPGLIDGVVPLCAGEELSWQKHSTAG